MNRTEHIEEEWGEKVKDYCEYYSIPLDYLAEILYDPKVAPMIRGKAFERSAMLALQQMLRPKEWEVDKPAMNPQSGIHDIDVRVFHRPTKKTIKVECKLADKGSYKLRKDGTSEIRVKCMRSRTLGPRKVKEIAPKIGVEEAALAVHNDSYRLPDFDIVVTSIGNAFYDTDNAGRYVWAPSEKAIDFLRDLSGSSTNIKSFAFNAMYVAKASDLVVSQASGVICPRRNCRNKRDCGFIPNYPIMRFRNGRPADRWLRLEESLDLFRSFVS